MATLAPAARLNSERRFFLGMAIALAVCTFAGFSRTYYLMSYTGAPELAWTVHLHGVVFTLWVLLFGLQAGLISARRTDIHVITGAVGVGLAVLMVGLGLLIAVTRSKPPALSPFTVDRFLIFLLVSIGLFAIFLALAFFNRHRPDYHKRYMLVATINVIVPALSRMTGLLPFLPRGVLGGLMIANLFLAALLVFDLLARRRIHPATMIGVGVSVLFEPLRFIVARSDWWPPIARALIP